MMELILIAVNSKLMFYVTALADSPKAHLTGMERYFAADYK